MLPSIDLHIHSQFSPCAENVTMLDDARVAVEKGLQLVAITDHGTVRHPAWLNKYLKELERVKEVFGDKLTILSGMEVDIIEGGKLAVSREIIKSLEIIVASIHVVPVGVGIIEYWRKSLLKAIKGGYVKVLGHPTDIGWKKIAPPVDYVLEVLDEAREAEVAIEINFHHKDPHLSFLKSAVERKVKLVPNSDAHNLSEIGMRKWHLEQIKIVCSQPDSLNWLKIEDLLT
ncbi:MAG: PHP domain-containing protein [Thermofilaceae archaeon]